MSTYKKLFKSHEDKADKKEVYWNGDTVNGYWCEWFGDAKEQEHIQQAYLHDIVDNVCHTETQTIAHRCLTTEGETCGQNVIEYKTDYIANGIGNVDFNMLLQKVIYSIMDNSGNGTYYDKTKYLTYDVSISHNSLLLMDCSPPL